MLGCKYHYSKKYDQLINVLGADHTGYIKRITAAVSALSNNKIATDLRYWHEMQTARVPEAPEDE